MLRWLVDDQALPALMWGMVGLSAALVAAGLFLLLARLLPAAVSLDTGFSRADLIPDHGWNVADNEAIWE